MRRNAWHLYKLDGISICLLMLVLLCALTGCKNRVPEGIISRGTMTDLLYDYHVAQALASSSSDSVDFKTRLYTAAVFEKYGVSEKEFDRSMAYYYRHAEDLYKIYEKINKRFGEYTSGGVKGLANISADGDTANIWKGNMCYFLSAAGNNRMEYSFAADTLLHAKDHLVWNFSTQWIYHNGAKNAVAVLAIEYANDSVATTVKTIFSTGEQHVEAFIGNVKPRKVTCMIYQVSSYPEKPRYFVVSSPSLIRIRAKEKPATDDALKKDTADSAARPITPALREKGIRDSLLRNDSALQPHFK